MSNKQAFIEYVKSLMDNANIPMEENVQKYWESLCAERPAKEKPPFTENGKMVLAYMKDNYANDNNFTAKSIADNLMVSGRTVSGCMRKLVTDGYVEKASVDPVSYCLTDKGIEVVF